MLINELKRVAEIDKFRELLSEEGSENLNTFLKEKW